MSNDFEPLQLEREAGIATITLANPPVNALYGAMRDGIAALLPQLDADPSIGAILFLGAGRAFSAGVDLKRTAQVSEPFFFHAALEAMDRVQKPLLAAIHGAAMGGGLELALACHYRLAGPQARFALPEVEVGIIPGACGTQRLPRLIPLARALDVAALGDILAPDEALALGLIDDLTRAPDFRTATLAWATQKIGARLRRTRDLPVQATENAEQIFAAAAARAARERPGEDAPARAIIALRAACTLDFDAGVEIEREQVTICKGSAQAKAMRHLFFAERNTGKLAAAPTPLPALALTGPGNQKIAALGVKLAAGGVPLHATHACEEIPVTGNIVVIPANNRGIAELAIPPGQAPGLTAALAKLLRPLGRALVISQGVPLSTALPNTSDSNALADAGAALLAQGVAASAADIDLVAVASRGFPRSLGGPLYQRDLR